MALVVYFGIENIIDRILIFSMTVSSLLCCAGIITGISELLLHNININIYFGITSFFVFGYLYNIVYREEYERNVERLGIFIPILLVKDESTKSFEKELVRSTIYVGYLCNVIRIVLLILDVFDKQYSLGIQQYPISEAVVTSLAVEKLIKSHYNKLGSLTS